MAKEILVRGFKAWCENTSLQFRRELDLKTIDPLKPQLLAAHLGISLFRPEQLTSLSVSAREILLGKEHNSWSAVMVSSASGDAIVYNPTHSRARQTSDIMHELSHVVRGHRPSTVVFSYDSAFALRSYDSVQEEEAAWLSGCLLLPRPALLWIVKSRMSTADACNLYEVSRDLLTYRIDVTGVKRQLRILS